jgi:hypothetical protein
MTQYRKLIVAVLGVAGVAVCRLLDMDVQELVAGATAVGVYLAPND